MGEISGISAGNRPPLTRVPAPAGKVKSTADPNVKEITFTAVTGAGGQVKYTVKIDSKSQTAELFGYDFKSQQQIKIGNTVDISKCANGEAIAKAITAEVEKYRGALQSGSISLPEAGTETVEGKIALRKRLLESLQLFLSFLQQLFTTIAAVRGIRRYGGFRV